MLSIVFVLRTASVEPTYNVSYVLSTSGLYYKNEGSLKIANTDWDIMIYMNLSPNRVLTLRTYFASIVDMCDNVFTKMTIGVEMYG